MRRTILIGAGFSFDLGMPLAGELTEVFLELFSPRSSAALAKALSRQQPYGRDRPTNGAAIREGVDLVMQYKAKNGRNYEELLTEIDALGRREGKNQSDRDSYNYVISFLYDLIHQILFTYQLISYEELYHLNRSHFAGLSNLLSDQETWIFSLNHDLFVECLAIDLGIPITYGDSGELVFPERNIHPQRNIHFTCSKVEDLRKEAGCWITGEKGINLVRLHGGFAELQYKDGSVLCNPSLTAIRSSELMAEVKRIESMGYFDRGRRVPSGKTRVVTGPEGTLDIIERSVLMGARKYSVTTNEKKGEEKLKLFDDVLQETDELTVIGYSFGDKHVNFRVSNAMVRNAELQLKIVEPARRPRPEFLEQFNYNSRLRGGQCGAAQWMSFVKAKKWDSEQMKALKRNAAVRNRIRDMVRAAFER